MAARRISRQNAHTMSQLRQVPKPLAAALAVFSGFLVAIQSRVTGQLATYLGGDGMYAAALALTVGLVIIVVALAFMPSGRRALTRVPGLVRSKTLHPWELLGGLGGASFVAAQGIVVPRAGVAPFTVSTVAGQTANSVVVDRLGLAPGGKRHITWQRLVAAVTATVAVAIAVAGRSSSHQLAIGFIVVPMFAGALTAIQQAFNSKVAVASGSSVAATFINFVVATSALYIAVAADHLITSQSLATPPGFSHAWLYLGGPLGASFIAIAALIVGRLGVLVFGLATILGQLVGAVILDAFFPTPGTHLGWATFVSVGVTAFAVVLAAWRPRRSVVPSP